MLQSLSNLFTYRRPFSALALAIAFVFGLHAPIESKAQLRCENVFKGLEAGTAARSNLSLKNDKTTSTELTKYLENINEIQKLLSSLPQDQADQIRHVVGATEFFDYQHVQGKFLTDFLSGRTSTYDFSKIYDENYSQNGLPYKNYVAARTKLMSENPPITPELLLNIHRQMMSGGVEQVPPDALGKWRNVGFMGNVNGPFKITAPERKAIEENLYLTFKENPYAKETRYNSFWDNIKISIFGKKEGLTVSNDELIAGTINYPNISNASPTLIAKIKTLDPAFAKEVEDYQAQRLKPLADKEAYFTEVLVKERFNRFNQDRAALGKINIGQNEQPFIKLVADLQRDLVAIHPLYNGNGRSTRLFLNYIFMREGLPPVRLVDPMSDIQSSSEQWQSNIQQGLDASAKLIADIKNRIELGLPIQNSANLIFPGLPGEISIGKKTQGHDKYTPNVSTAKVDPNQFTSFVKVMMDLNPSLKIEIQNNRIRTMSRLAELFQEFYRSKTIRYMHDKDGDQQIGLRLIDEDFITTFGTSFRMNQENWNQKISRWYDSNMYVWRGLADKATEYTTQDLLKYFTHPSSHLMSNNVLRRSGYGSNNIELIKEDFRKYNKDLITGDLVKMADDHHKSGPLYGQSYGFSTSKREVVGKAFAMGAMVIGTYGEHKDPALQAKLKSRINVAMYRAKKDVDLGRLKAFSPEFSYIYGRQAEVMGIGGVDPDAVMLIQKIDAKGNVEKTLYRNPTKADEILEIDGRFVPTEEALPWAKVKNRYKI